MTGGKINCLITEPEHVASHTKRIKLECYLVPKYRMDKKRKRKKVHTRNSTAAIGGVNGTITSWY